MRGLPNDQPHVRAWTIQLLTRRSGTRAIGAALDKVGRRWPQDDPSPVVRLYLGSALQRLPLDGAVGDSAGPAGARRRCRRPQPAADVLVRRRAAGRGRRGPGAGAGRRRQDSAGALVHGPPHRQDRHARGARTCWSARLGQSRRRRGATGDAAGDQRRAQGPPAGADARGLAGRRRRSLVNSQNAEVNAAGHRAGADVWRPGGAGQAARRARRRQSAAGPSAAGARRPAGRPSDPAVGADVAKLLVAEPELRRRRCAAWPPTTMPTRPPRFWRRIPSSAWRKSATRWTRWRRAIRYARRCWPPWRTRKSRPPICRPIWCGSCAI